MNPWILTGILSAHWFADFVMQTDKMAVNKSTSNKWLLSHVLCYSLWLGILTAWIFPFPQAIAFVALNGMAHAITDYGTSRWTSYLWKKQDRHNFFVVIGLDQLIHTVTLIGTYNWLS